MFLTLITSTMFFFSRRKKNDGDEEKDAIKDALLCRFVFDGAGRKIGETVSLDGDIIIIKSGGNYLGVPLKHVEEKEKTLLVKGLVDFDKALEMGEQWREESFCEIDQTDQTDEYEGEDE